MIPGSPAHEAGLEPFFDFIVAVNGTEVRGSEKGRFFKTRLDAWRGASLNQVL